MKFCTRSALAFAAVFALALIAGGCRKPQVRVYLAPKDPPPREESAQEAQGPQSPQKPKGHVTYKLPAGWEEAQPNSVSLAAFSIKSGSAEAGVNVTPLPNLAGREAVVVNMWRDQVGLPPIEEGELAKTLEAVEIGSEKGQMFEVLGAREGGAPMRIVTAFFHKPDASWFFKLNGDEALVTAQKPVFVEFLKSVKVNAEEASEPAAPAASEAPKWSGPVPEGWQPLAPGNMQVAKFSVPEKDGAKAEVSVSVFPGDTGGMVANVNRWRRQLGLAEADEAGVKANVSPLAAAPDAMLVDLKNESRALLGAIVPRDGRWWFYKMLGDEAAVSAARESFIGFTKSALKE